MTEHGVVIMQPYSFKTWGSFNGPLWQENYPQDSELRGKFRKETVERKIEGLEKQTALIIWVQFSMSLLPVTTSSH